MTWIQSLSWVIVSCCKSPVYFSFLRCILIFSSFPYYRKYADNLNGTPFSDVLYCVLIPRLTATAVHRNRGVFCERLSSAERLLPSFVPSRRVAEGREEWNRGNSPAESLTVQHEQVSNLEIIEHNGESGGHHQNLHRDDPPPTQLDNLNYCDLHKLHYLYDLCFLLLLYFNLKWFHK